MTASFCPSLRRPRWSFVSAIQRRMMLRSTPWPALISAIASDSRAIAASVVQCCAVPQAPCSVKSALPFERSNGPLRRIHRHCARLAGEHGRQQIGVAKHRFPFGHMRQRPACGFRRGVARTREQIGRRTLALGLPRLRPHRLGGETQFRRLPPPTLPKLPLVHVALPRPRHQRRPCRQVRIFSGPVQPALFHRRLDLRTPR